jgi:hypothetical protein
MINIKNLRSLPIIFLDETKENDIDYKNNIEQFKNMIKETTKQKNIFNIDLTYTCLTDIGIKNLINLLSENNSFQYIKKIDLSNTRFHNIELLEDLFFSTSIEYINVVATYIDLNDINKLIDKLEEKNKDFNANNIIYSKLIWLNSHYFLKQSEFPGINELSLKTHLTYYKIKF